MHFFEFFFALNDLSVDELKLDKKLIFTKY